MKFASFFLLLFLMKGVYLRANIYTNIVINNLTDRMVNYDKKIIPSEYGDPINVKVSISIFNMVPYKRKDKHYTVEFFFRNIWHDYRMEYKSIVPKEYHNMFVPLPPKFGLSLWQPGLYFIAGKDGGLQTSLQPNVLTNILPNGTIHMSQRHIIVVACKMDFKHFPFDINICDFELESHAFPQEFVTLSWVDKNPVEMPENRDMLEYNLQNLSHSKGERKHNIGYTWDNLNVKFVFQRNINYHILQTFLPLHMNIILSWIGFWIDFHCTPARVSLSVTSVLTMITLVDNIRSNLPSHEITSLEWYISICLVYVFLALIEYTIVGITNLYWKDLLDKKEEAPNGFSRKLSVFGKEENQNNDIEVENGKPTTNTNGGKKNAGNIRNRFSNRNATFKGTKMRVSQKILSMHQRNKHEVHIIDLVSRYLFPISFIVTDILYFVLVKQL